MFTEFSKMFVSGVVAYFMFESVDFFFLGYEWDFMISFFKFLLEENILNRSLNMIYWRWWINHKESGSYDFHFIIFWIWK